jgi:hypothetical protein
MAWLVKSEVNGAPLTQEEYEKETLKLPHGKEKYASLYEHLEYLYDIDEIAILVSKIRNVGIPELFCTSHDLAGRMYQDGDAQWSYRMLTTFFIDENRKDSCSSRYRFNDFRYPLRDIITALLHDYDSEDNSASALIFTEVHNNILTLQKAYASEIFASIDEKDKEAYYQLMCSFRCRYEKITDELITPRDLISSFTFEDMSLSSNIKQMGKGSSTDSNSLLCGKRIPEIILELEQEKQLLRKEEWFIASVSAKQLVMGLDEERKRYLRKAFREWIHKQNGGEYTEDTIDMYYKS